MKQEFKNQSRLASGYLYCLFVCVVWEVSNLRSALCPVFLAGSVEVTLRKSSFLPGSRIKSWRAWRVFGPGSASLLLCTGEALRQLSPGCTWAEISCSWLSWLVVKGVQAPLGPRCPLTAPDRLQQKC